jgi:thiol-disulfide isomerase/thioredoxin
MNKQTIIDSVKKRLKIKNLLNGLFFSALLLLLLNSSAKALVIEGLMKIGLFQPNISLPAKSASVPGDISFLDDQGTIIKLSSLKGKVVFINFWATWCPPCIAELPSINKLHNQLSVNKNIVFLLVDADNDFKKSLPFMAKHNFKLPVYTAIGTVPENMLGNSIPATAVINKQGEMVFHHEGAADYSDPEFANYLVNLSAN